MQIIKCDYKKYKCFLSFNFIPPYNLFEEHLSCFSLADSYTFALARRQRGSSLSFVHIFSFRKAMENSTFKICGGRCLRYPFWC